MYIKDVFNVRKTKDITGIVAPEIGPNSIRTLEKQAPVFWQIVSAFTVSNHCFAWGPSFPDKLWGLVPDNSVLYKVLQEIIKVISWVLLSE